MGRTLELKATTVFDRHWRAVCDPSTKVIVHQGGSRSGKTYAIVQSLVLLAHRERGCVISVVRKTGPALKATVQRDFVSVMETLGIYDPDAFNKTEGIYRFENGSVVEFFAVDDSVKTRGRKRRYCFVNEATELSAEEFLQLRLRTERQLFIDFNPSEESGWFYDVAQEDGSVLIRSTFRDNGFLGTEQSAYIDGLSAYDENYHRVYALGERPTRTDRVYTHFVTHADRPKGVTRTTFGLDFGWVDPHALVRCDWVGDDVYLEQLYYRSGRTTTELVADVKDLVRDGPVFCDHRPEVIEELRRAGVDARPARKEIVAGIDNLRRRRVSVHSGSLELLDEVRRYSYRTLRTGELSDGVPLDRFNHLLDASRYATHGTETLKPQHSVFVFSE